MCGIIAYLGGRNADQLLIDGLVRLEYRGYDSAGLAIQNGKGVEVRKSEGSVSKLKTLVHGTPIKGTCGIAHTRWATHGAPNHTNAHPHTDCSGQVAVVHNGIIENASALRTHLEGQGHTFRSETDTEVLAHLIEEAQGDTLEEKVIEAISRVEGTYGMAALSNEGPGKIVVARNGSPLLLGIGEDGELFAASDAAAILEHTRSVIYLEDGEVAVLENGAHRILDREGVAMTRTPDRIDWELEAIELGGYRHFMEKEIAHQADTVRDAMRGRLDVERGMARLGGLSHLDPNFLDGIDRIILLGCGTSWHAGLVARYMIESLAGIPVQVEYASEFRYRRGPSLSRSLVIAISQSGETADTLEALRAARRAGALVLGAVNVVGSSIARESDGGVYLHCGPEISVASTKAFTAQLTVLSLMALFFGRHRGLDDQSARRFASALARLPEKVGRALEMSESQGIEELARGLNGGRHALFLGRGISFPVALEGALKLKEISYIHAEGYPAAELKHGPIALIDEDMPVIFVAPRDRLFQKVLSNVAEVRARGGHTIMITTGKSDDLRGVADHVIRVPRTVELLSPITSTIPLQLLAYHTAVNRGCNVDQPRNLAKSVTVE
jgi:glutamine---fructose-6-phosphate transaminase (isomerizing)